MRCLLNPTYMDDQNFGLPGNSSCITAFSNTSQGIILLPTTIQLSAVLAAYVIHLEKHPELTVNVQRDSMKNETGEGEGEQTLVERTAESIQRAFTMCLTERSVNRNGLGADGK